MSQALTLSGVLDKQQTVGYRSPYGLTVRDPASIPALAEAAGWQSEPGYRVEVRGDSELFEEHLSQEVEIRGLWVVVPGGPAEPGSEGESRFVGGMIPTLFWLEVESLRVLSAD